MVMIVMIMIRVETEHEIQNINMLAVMLLQVQWTNQDAKGIHVLVSFNFPSERRMKRVRLFRFFTTETHSKSLENQFILRVYLFTLIICILNRIMIVFCTKKIHFYAKSFQINKFFFSVKVCVKISVEHSQLRSIENDSFFFFFVFVVKVQITCRHKCLGWVVCFRYRRIHRHCRRVVVADQANDVSSPTSFILCHSFTTFCLLSNQRSKK